MKIASAKATTRAWKRSVVGSEIIGVDDGNKRGSGDVLKVIPWRKPQQTPRRPLHIIASFSNA